MAPKRSAHLDDPPSASSDEDDTEEEEQEQETVDLKGQESSSEEGSSEEESEGEEDDDEDENENATPAKKPQVPDSSSDDSEAEPDPDVSSPTASAFTIKPSKTDSVETPSKAASKRPAEADTPNRKKPRVSNGGVEDGKKSANKMVWTDEKVIALLKGFLDYQSEKGSSDMEGFHQFIGESLSGDASTNQVYDKLRRMKKKYRTNVEKGGGDGKDPVFSKPHDQEIFELSKKIWGINGSVSRINGSKSKKRTKGEQSKHVKEENGEMEETEVNGEQEDTEVNGEKEDDEEEEDDDDDEVRDGVEEFEAVYPYWYAGLRPNSSPGLGIPGVGMKFIKENWKSIDSAKAKELDERWKAFFAAEKVIQMEKMGLFGKACKLVVKNAKVHEL